MTCSSCAYFQSANGECRRNAPIPVGHRQYAQWPRVRETDWCGQHRKAQASERMEALDDETEADAFKAGQAAE